MTTTELFDQAAALSRLADDGCPHHGNALSQQSERGAGDSVLLCPRQTVCARALTREPTMHWKKLLRTFMRYVEEIERRANIDPLTRQANRGAIEMHAAAEVQRRDRYNGPLALGLIDVDHFKEINTRHTHEG